MRWHRPTAVEVGIDEGCQRLHRFQPGIDRQAHLAENGEIGSEPGRDDQRIDGHRVGLRTQLARHGDAPGGCRRHRVDMERCQGGDPSFLHRLFRPLPERATGRQGVRQPAAKHRVEVLPPHGPQHTCGGCRVPERQQVEHHVERRMAAAHDEDRLVGVPCPIAPLHVGDTVGDPPGTRGLPMRRQATRSQRIGLAPGARGVDDRASFVLLRPAARCFDPNNKGLSLAPGSVDFVHLLTAHGDHACAQVQVWGHDRQGSEWGEISIDQRIARGKSIRLGGLPASSLQKPLGGRIDEIAPGREEPHMAPLPDRMPNGGARSQDQRALAPLQEVCSGGEPDRARPNDRNRQRRRHRLSFLLNLNASMGNVSGQKNCIRSASENQNHAAA